MSAKRWRRARATACTMGAWCICPTEPAPGKAYQRVIKTEGADGWAYDLRTACVGRRPVVVFLKQKPASARFSIQNTSVVVKTPEEVFSRRRDRPARTLLRSDAARLGRPRRAARTRQRPALRGGREQDRHRARPWCSTGATARARRRCWRMRCGRWCAGGVSAISASGPIADKRPSHFLQSR